MKMELETNHEIQGILELLTGLLASLLGLRLPNKLGVFVADTVGH